MLSVNPKTKTPTSKKTPKSKSKNKISDFEFRNWDFLGSRKM